MTTGDFPTFIDAGHSHTVYGLGNLSTGTLVQGTTTAGSGNAVLYGNLAGIGNLNVLPDLRGRTAAPVKPQKEKPMTDKPGRRLVQVIIVDPDDNVPLDQSLLYSGSQKLTDATDQELFFEIDIKTVLADHNTKRTAIVNKKIKDRTENLEPAKIRDLKMVVVNVASF